MIRLASALRAVAVFAALAGLVIAVLGVARPQFSAALGLVSFTLDATELAALPHWLAGIVSAIPALTFAYAMYQLAQLLKLAMRAQVFSAPAANYLRGFGLWLLVTTLAESLLPAAAQMLHLWWTHTHGSVELSISSAGLWNIFISALFMLVARVLADAYRIAEDNRQII